MKSERQIIVDRALAVLNERTLRTRPGRRSGGFDDATAMMQLARRNALTHEVCGDCNNLTVSIEGDRVMLACRALKSPTDMWAQHQMTGTFGSEPQCPSFTVIEETSKQV